MREAMQPETCDVELAHPHTQSSCDPLLGPGFRLDSGQNLYNDKEEKTILSVVLSPLRLTAIFVCLTPSVTRTILGGVFWVVWRRLVC